MSEVGFRDFMYDRIVSPISQVVTLRKWQDTVQVDADGNKKVVRDIYDVALYNRRGIEYRISNVYTVDFTV